MSAIALGELYLRARARCVGAVRELTLRKFLPVWFVGLAVFAVSPLRAQTFDPSVTVGAGIRGSYVHDDPNGSGQSDQFLLNDARIYISGTVTDNINFMFNTDYNGATNNIGILDAAGEFAISPKFNIWVGRFLPPSDRANLYGPFYANEWDVYTDGIQDGYPFIFQGRDNGVMYWGDFKAGIAKIKISAGAFDPMDGSKEILGAARVQVDFWDPEGGYYLNGTYYGDKDLLAIGLASETQSDKTATTADFLLEKKVMNGGAFSLESEYADYNGLGGYNGDYLKSQGAYGLASFLFPKEIGIGKIQVLGKYALAQFTDGIAIGGGHHDPSFRQQTVEANVNYVIKEFDARVMTFFKDTRFNAVEKDDWQAGVGLQFQISKTIK